MALSIPRHEPQQQGHVISKILRVSCFPGELSRLLTKPASENSKRILSPMETCSPDACGAAIATDLAGPRSTFVASAPYAFHCGTSDSPVFRFSSLNRSYRDPNMPHKAAICLCQIHTPVRKPREWLT